MVDKLKHELLPHPKPYKLHWITDGGDINVKNQVKVKFFVGNYVDNVLCDVVPMEACYVLLGRPWQFDKQTTHDGLTNEITFTHNKKKFVLHPLTPTQVLEDQVQMKSKLNNERKSKTPRAQNLSIKDTSEVWELGVPSHKVTQKESLLTKNSLKTCLLIEQPPYLLLCKGTLMCAHFDKFETKALPPSIEKLLKEFGDIFPSDGPTGLPPF